MDADGKITEIEETAADKSGVGEDVEGKDPGLAEASEAEEERKQANSVPLKRFLEEKKRRKEAEQAAREAAETPAPANPENEVQAGGKAEDDDRSRIYRAVRDALAREGCSDPDGLAESMMAARNFGEESDEITELARNPYYADAGAFRREIAELRRRFAGITAKNAYDMLRGERRAGELLRKQSALAELERWKSERAKAFPTEFPDAGPPAEDADARALRRLQAIFPGKGWDEAKYTAAMKRNGILREPER